MIALAIILAAAAVPSKSAVQSYDFPDADSCATWTLERAKPDFHNQEYEGWILGFITGLNAFGPNNGNIAPGTNAAGLIGWVDNYCRANPLDAVTTAGFKLADELQRRARRTR